jgi:CBS domain-containing protein
VHLKAQDRTSAQIYYSQHCLYRFVLAIFFIITEDRSITAFSFSTLKLRQKNNNIKVFSMLKVKDVFSKGFSQVHEKDTFTQCFSLFKKKKPPVLAVFDGKENYKGVITRRWITRSRFDSSNTKVKGLMRVAPKVTEETSLSEAARLMIESSIRQLPVFSGENLLGFVTDEDIIHGAVVEKWGSKKTKEIMTAKPFVLEEDESVGAALSLFREHNISHAPVVKNGKLVGLLSIHDVIENVFQPKERQTYGEIVGEKVPVLSIPVKGIMSRPAITVLPTNRLRYAVEKMHRFDISSLAVVQRKRPVGILTKLDFLEPIAQMEKPCRRLSVQFSINGLGVDDVQRRFIMDDFESFAQRYGKTVESGTLFVYLKSHGSSLKGDQLVHCRLQLRTVKGSFFSSGEGWGVEQTFRLALDRLEGQILKSKELPHDRKFAREYLRRMRFPLSDI